jgi:hypothetical protein
MLNSDEIDDPSTFLEIQKFNLKKIQNDDQEATLKIDKCRREVLQVQS